MKRREFITLIGGAATTWPLAAWAQQGERVPRIGVLNGASPDDTQLQARMSAFVQGLQQLGWVDGRNVRIDYRWGGGNPETIRKHAMELAAHITPDARRDLVLRRKRDG